MIAKVHVEISGKREKTGRTSLDVAADGNGKTVLSFEAIKDGIEVETADLIALGRMLEAIGARTPEQ